MSNKIKFQHGLTLIELMISLVIVSVVVTLCANGFNFGSRVWSKVSIQQDHLDEVASAQRFIRKALNEALFYVLEKDSKRNYFTGEENKMIFLAPSPQYGLDDYLYIYEIYKQKVGERYNLSVRYLPANTYFSGTASTTDKYTKLLTDVRNLKFQYYGFNNQAEEFAWHDSWISQDSLPMKISISTESSAEWPVLIADTKFGAYRLQ